MATDLSEEVARELWGGVSPQSRESVRAAIAGLERQRASEVRVGGKCVSVSVRRVRAQSGVRQEHVAQLVRLYKAGLTPDVAKAGSWDHGLDGKAPPRSRRRKAAAVEPPAAEEQPEDLGPDPLVEVAELARTMETHGDAREVLRRTASLVLTGDLSKERVLALKSVLNESRQYLRDERSDPASTVDRTFFASPEAVALIRVFEGIVSEERRGAVLECAVDQARLDVAENPAGDMAAGHDQDGSEEAA